ncbi:MAG: LysM peptidoglycan-binding domain-containing protein, partial [Anaerolineae bacterium]
MGAKYQHKHYWAAPLACILVAALAITGCSQTPEVAPTATVVAIANTATSPPKPWPALTATATATPQPTPTQTATATLTEVQPTASPLYHTVEQGEWPELIAEAYSISVDELMAANGLDRDSSLSVGQVLLIPTPSPEPGTFPTAAPTANPLVYTVVSGDYPEKVATKFDVSLEDLLSANGLDADAVLSIGQVLVIPTPVSTPTAAEPTSQGATATPQPTPEIVYVTITHVVESGDTIESIADSYGVTWEEIADINGITKNTVLSIGQELVVPNVAVESSSLPTATATASTSTKIPDKATTPTPEPTEIATQPAKVFYTVSEGDYLELVASRFGITPEE